MDNKLTMQDLALGMAQRGNSSRKDAETFIRKVFDIIEDFVIAEGVVKIKGLGVFKMVAVDSRESVDVNTGERITISSHSRLTFTPHAALRDQVNRPFADFETVVLNDETTTEEMEYTESDVPSDDVPTNDEQPVVEQEVPIIVDTTDEETTPDESVSTDTSIAQEEINNTASPEEETPTPATDEATEQTVLNQNVEEMSVGKQYVEHQTIQQVVSSALEEELTKRDKRGPSISWGGVVAFILLTILLMIGAFYAGYRYAQKHEAYAAPSISIKKAEPMLKPKAREAKTEVTKPEPEPEPNYAELYPQVEGGDYWITGTLEEHEIVVGDNVYALAKKAYGNKDLANYIIRYNNIKDPDKILLGFKIKLPTLKKKEQ